MYKGTMALHFKHILQNICNMMKIKLKYEENKLLKVFLHYNYNIALF